MTCSASIMRGYDWGAQLHELEARDLVGFRSWLLKEYTRDQAKRTLSCFHSMLIEMVTQGVLATDPAARITIQRSTGSPEAVTRPRFPQNVACGFPAPTLFGSWFTALRAPAAPSMGGAV
jgi:hypothetical protein